MKIYSMCVTESKNGNGLLNYKNGDLDIKYGDSAGSYVSSLSIGWYKDLPSLSKDTVNGNGATPYSSTNTQYVKGSWQTTAGAEFGNIQEYIFKYLESMFTDGVPAPKQKNKVFFISVYATGDVNNPVGVAAGITSKKTYVTSSGSYTGNTARYIINAEKVWCSYSE
jgi:hypothetical protein